MLVPYSVSIPNGMEFYSTAFLVFSLEVSFNSQRDGILRDTDSKKPVLIYEFQFPTGWNST